jgi:gamma-glutamyltranspeptidase/glutathione hydrolase
MGKLGPQRTRNSRPPPLLRLVARLLGAAGLWLGWLMGTACLCCNPAIAQTMLPRRHMIATPDRLATEAGLAILREGGSAVDAAVAAAMVLAVVRPDESGLGGGGILLHFAAATRRVTVWDGRETAPAAATANLLLDAAGQPLAPAAYGPGGRAVGAPGLLRMLDAAQRAHGKLPWERLFAAATTLAATGTPISPALAAAIAGETARLARQPTARAILLGPGGAVPPAGTMRANPALAETLRAVAAGRADALLAGPMAAEIATTVRTDPNPGLLTVDDLGAVSATEHDALCAPYRGRRVCSAGPPSSGGMILLQTLGLLGHAGLPALAPSAGQPIGIAAAHLLAEAERLAGQDAAFYLADPAFVHMPLAGLLAPFYLEIRAQLIDPIHAMAAAGPGNPQWDTPELRAAPDTAPQHGTAHVVVVDDDGNAVSLGATLQDRFGSGLMVRGVLLNDSLSGFSPLPQRDGRDIANRVEPGKRPLTPMAPAMVFDAEGHLLAVLGAAGGDRIPAEEAQALVETLDFQRTPAAALADRLISEGNVAVDLAAEDHAHPPGHPGAALLAPDDAAGGVSMIEITHAGLQGAVDPRIAEGDCAGD